jgi:hypothetical protein
MRIALLLATVSPSEEIGQPLFFIAAACFILAAGLALIAAGIHLFAPQKHKLGSIVALTGLVLALVEFAFAWQVRHIDFVPFGISGAAPSPPLLKSLFVPFVPVLMNGLLLIAHRRAGRNPVP